LDDLSKLIGQREERAYSESIGADGRRSSSSSSREVPVMDTSRLRMLPFGTAVLMSRAARPIVLTMTSWTQRARRSTASGITSPVGRGDRACELPGVRAAGLVGASSDADSTTPT
ncbi:MAG TPA: hypothetical protein VIJ07_06380, partial [Dermatophilaceae bacterium]